MSSREPVVDFVPPGTPPVLTDRIESAIERTDDTGVSSSAWETMLDEQVRQLREDSAFRDRLREIYHKAEVDVVCATVWTTDPGRSPGEGTFHDLARWNARFDAVDWLRPVRSPDDARRVASTDDVGIVLGTQNLGRFTAKNPERVETLYNAGLRVMQPTYNRQNHLGGGCLERSQAGLSDHGSDAVRRLNELGCLVDLSHCNEPTTLETVEASSGPVAYTHTHCGALHDHPRSKSDPELKALAENDGYAGILVYPHHYEEPTFETFFEHFEHAVSILGAERVGVATDWWMTTPDVPEPLRPALVEFFDREIPAQAPGASGRFTTESFDRPFERIEEYADRTAIREAFEERGYTAGEIDRFLGGNFLDAWERAR